MIPRKMKRADMYELMKLPVGCGISIENISKGVTVLPEV